MSDSKAGWESARPVRERQVLQDRFIDLEPLKKLLKEIFPACAEEDFKVQVCASRADVGLNADLSPNNGRSAMTSTSIWLLVH